MTPNLPVIQILTTAIRMLDKESRTALDDYRSLEVRVGVLMRGICRPFCLACDTICCRIEICQEAWESPFLNAIGSGTQRFHSSRGYLGATGCRLQTGRPSICHRFICDRIMQGQTNDIHQYGLRCLGDLMGFAGKKVWRGKHPAAAPLEADLHEINIRRFRHQIATAEAALEILDNLFTRNICPGVDDIGVLAQIYKPSMPP